MLDVILALAGQFRSGGYDLYMVGGTVRDLLLRRAVSADADLTTNARPDEIKRLAAPTNPDAVVSVGEQFGTVRLHYRRHERADEQSAESASPSPVAVVVDHAPDVDVV